MPPANTIASCRWAFSSDPGSHFQRAVELVRSGAIGKVVYAEAWNHGRGPERGHRPCGTASAPPAGLDWEMWLGPAPAAPYRKNIHPGRWRVFYDYGGGNLADWGVHLLDIIQWAIQADTPLSVHTTGGKLLDRRRPHYAGHAECRV